MNGDSPRECIVTVEKSRRSETWDYLERKTNGRVAVR